MWPFLFIQVGISALFRLRGRNVSDGLEQPPLVEPMIVSGKVVTTVADAAGQRSYPEAGLIFD
jgi:hypothetical protein